MSKRTPLETKFLTGEVNPTTVTLEDIEKMTPREFRMYSFLKLNHLEGKVSKVDSRIWWVLTSVVVFGIGAIAAAMA